MNKDILICGVGGQGTVLTARIIAAAAMDEGHTVHSAETIGMAQRGGPVTNHVRIGDDASSPLIPKGRADLMIAFEPSEAVRNIDWLNENSLVIVNSVPVKPFSAAGRDDYDGKAEISCLQSRFRCIIVDSESLCRPFGSPRFFNMAALGIAAGAGEAGAGEEALRNKIKTTVAARFVEMNLRAFETGVGIGKDQKENKHADQ